MVKKRTLCTFIYELIDIKFMKYLSINTAKPHDLTILKYIKKFLGKHPKNIVWISQAIKRKTGGNLHHFYLIAPNLSLRTGIFALSDRKPDVR